MIWFDKIFTNQSTNSTSDTLPLVKYFRNAVSQYVIIVAVVLVPVAVGRKNIIKISTRSWLRLTCFRSEPLIWLREN